MQRTWTNTVDAHPNLLTQILPVIYAESHAADLNVRCASGEAMGFLTSLLPRVITTGYSFRQDAPPVPKATNGGWSWHKMQRLPTGTPNLPPGFFPLERICMNCESYTFVARPKEEGLGWAFCKHFKKHFQYQFDPTHDPAGGRTCQNWVQKGTING